MTDVKIKVTFVIPKYCTSENDCPEDMLIAYAACENHRGGGLQAQWTHENSISLEPPPMKSDIYVLSEFDGEVYEKLKATKCLLLGPRCLSCSLTEGNTIPSKGHPVFTVAMRGLIVSISGLSKELKTSIKQKIEWMGGTYSAVLSSETTHLIANNVFSDKYIKAAERGIPVMQDSWPQAVWDASLKLDINGASADFNTHRLPPFANLQITTSGLSTHDKKMVMKLVNANGGDFSRVFLSQSTDVLVLTKDTTGSEKYKAAIEWGKVCVTPHWIKDSAALGFALPVSRYKVSSATTSSPVNNRMIPDMSLNLTRITGGGRPNNFVDESKMAESIMLSGTSKLHQESKKDTSGGDEIQKAFEAFDVASIKKAGPIFDGFCIWVSGIEGAARERAGACVSRAGGVRYDGPHPRVTHAVSWGAAASAAASALPSVPVLSPLWLIRSVEAGRVLDEAEFLLNPGPATPRKSKSSQPPVAAASPMSKRTLQLLLPPSTKEDSNDAFKPPEDHIVDHYLSQNLSQAIEPQRSTEQVEKSEPAKNDADTVATVGDFTQSQSGNIFKDLIFEVQGLEDTAICEIGAEIREEGGMLVAAGAGGSHVLVPLDFDQEQRVTRTAEAVTVFWVKDCLSRQELTPIEYYHRPVRLSPLDSSPLAGVVASLSTYTGVERAFLDEVARLCGAVMQQRFCRRGNNSALASTHLICPDATGAKYAAARKWGVPSVAASWLLAAAETGARPNETEHAVHVDDTSTKSDNTLTNAPPKTPQAKTTPEPKIIETPQQRSDTTHQKSETKQNRSKSPEKRSKTPENRSKTPEKRSKTPEKRSKTPEKRSKTPEKRSKTPEKSKSPEPIRISPEPVHLENFDAEPMLPPDGAPNSPRQNKRKFKKVNSKNEFEGMSPASRFIAMRRMGMFSDHEDSSKENTPRKHGANDSDASFQDGDRERSIQTPPLEEVLSSPNLQGFSPNTKRRLQMVRRGEVPEEPVKTPVNPFDKKIETPDSDFGAALRPGTKRMSVDARKLLWEFVNELPTHGTSRERDAETPPAKMAKFTENQCAGGAKLSEPSSSTNRPSTNQQPSKPPAPAVPFEVDEQLQRLNVVLTGRRTPRRASRPSVQAEKPDMEYESGPESQPNTVGWDDTTPSQKDSFESVSKPQRVDTIPKLDDNLAKEPKKIEKEPDKEIPTHSKHNEEKDVNKNVSDDKMVVDLEADCSKVKEICTQTEVKEPEKVVKRFMLSSNVDNREETVEMILRLGAEVTDLDEEEEGSSPPATHLLCCAPARSQRVLNCIAAGCWVLHPAYVARSAAVGGLLPEEAFEWGNPSATCLPPVSGGELVLARAAHRWRARRRRGLPGPFAGVVALLHAPEPRRKLLARLVKAGGGSVVDEQPPYTDETITVCFADPKRYPMKERDRGWLVSRRVPVCASILLSAFLTEETRPDLNLHCLPEFKA